MRVDHEYGFGHRPDPSRKVQVGVSGRLRNALEMLAEGRGKVLRHAEKAWASITFEGARHTIALAFEGCEAVNAGERFIAALPDHEFAIPGQLVADATVTRAEHVLLPEPRLMVEIEVLLLKEV